MRCAIKISLPVDKFNDAVRDGSAGDKLQRILNDTNPESVYFWAEGGNRGGVMIVDLESSSQIPSIAEPWFLYFDANLEIHPCMTPEDLAAAGLDELGKQYG